MSLSHDYSDTMRKYYLGPIEYINVADEEALTYLSLKVAIDATSKKRSLYSD